MAIDRSEISRLVAKAIAYKQCGKDKDAEHFARSPLGRASGLSQRLAANNTRRYVMKQEFNLTQWLILKNYSRTQLATAFGTTPQRLGRIAKAGVADREFIYACLGYDAMHRPATALTGPLGETL